MGKTFKVLHWSPHWMEPGPKFLTFISLKEAEAYVSDFKGRVNFHYRDSFEIVQVLASGEAVNIDHDLVGFKLMPVK